MTIRKRRYYNLEVEYINNANTFQIYNVLMSGKSLLYCIILIIESREKGDRAT